MSDVDEWWDQVRHAIGNLGRPACQGPNWDDDVRDLFGAPGGTTESGLELVMRLFRESGRLPEANAIEECWSKLVSPHPSRHLEQHFAGPAPVSQDLEREIPDRDVVDAERLHDHLRVAFASGLATLWAHQCATKPDAWTEVQVWLGRAAGCETVPASDCDWTAGLHPIDVIERAAATLTGPFPGRFSRQAARQFALWWLNSLPRAKRSITIPIVAVNDTHSDGVIHEILFEILESTSGLLESPDIWNRLLGKDFVATVGEAYRAAWPDPASGPCVRWSIVKSPGPASGNHGRNEQIQRFCGTSHGLAVHVGCRLLSEGRQPDRSVIFSAQVRDGELDRVSGLPMKIQRAFDAGFRRFCLWERQLDQPDGLPSSYLVEYLKRNLEIRPVKSLAEAYVAAEMEVVLTRYLEWVSHQHGRLQLWGIPDIGATPSLDLRVVYVALASVEISPAEMAATVRVVTREEADSRPPGWETGESSDDDLHTRIPTRAHRLAESRSSDGGVPECNFGDALLQERVLVILGDPGGGKTTVLRWLACHLADAVRLQRHVVDGQARLVVERRQVDVRAPDDSGDFDLGPARLPILIRASQYVDEIAQARNSGTRIPTLYEVLSRPLWDKQPPVDRTTPQLSPLPADELARTIHGAIDAGRAVILIDGLDEVVSVELRSDLMKGLSEFIESHIERQGQLPPHGNQIVITSRVVGYWSLPVPAERWPKALQIKPMDRPAVEHFCRNRLRAAEARAERGSRSADSPATASGLIADLFDPRFPRRGELASNPLLLSVLVAVYSKGLRLPENRPDLYRVTIDYLIDAWRSQRIQPDVAQRLTTEEIREILGALAIEVHELHSSNVIDEKSARRIVASTLEEQDRPRGEVKELTDLFFSDPEMFAGSFVEVSRSQWRFLLQPIQEYLAARHLTRDPATMSDQLRARLGNPRCREVLLLALGIASRSETVSSRQFDQLVKDLLQASDDFDRIVPRGPLLLADSVSDLGDVPDWIWTHVAESLLRTYADDSGIGRFMPLRQKIEDSFEKLNRHWRIVTGNTVRNGFEEFLVQQLKRPDRGVAVARLMRERNWYGGELVRVLYDVRRFDAPGDDPVIDRGMQALAQETDPPSPPVPLGATAPARVTEPTSARRSDEDLPPQLEFRRWMRHAVQCGLPVTEFLATHPDWFRLIVTLFGGVEDMGMPKLLAEYFSLVQVLQAGGVLSAPVAAIRLFPQHDQDRVMLIASYLDQRKVDLRFWEMSPQFRPSYVYRDVESPQLRLQIREHLEQAVRSRDSASDTLSQLVTVLEAHQQNESFSDTDRAEALSGLLALGPDLVAGWESLAATARNSPAAQTELRRLREGLRDPVVRAAKRVVSQLEPMAPHFIREDLAIELLGAVLEFAVRNGFVPLSTAKTDALSTASPLLQGYLLAEAWAHWLSGCTDDFRYDAAVVLDTIGKRFQSNPRLLVAAINGLPLSKNIRAILHIGWPFERIPHSSDDELDRFLATLDAVAAMPEEVEFVRYWAMFDVLSPYLQEHHPDVVTELRADLLRFPYKASLDAVENHWPPLAEDPRDWITRQVQELSDPYLRARAYCRLALLWPENRAGFVAQARAAAIQVPLAAPASGSRRNHLWDWFVAGPPTSPRRTLALEQLLPFAELELSSLLREATTSARRLDPDNRARAFTRLARFADSTERPGLLRLAARSLEQVRDEDQRSRSLNILRGEWRLYPGGTAEVHRLCRTFRNPVRRARAMGRLTPTLRILRVDSSMSPHVDPQSAAVLELMSLVEDALQPVDTEDDPDALWVRLAEGDESALGKLRRLAEFDELPLNWSAAFALNQLLEKASEKQAMELLKLVRRPEPSTLPVVDRWLRRANSPVGVKAHAALLMAESGLMTVETIPGLVALLRSPDDRTRYRARKACYFRRNARHARAIGSDTIEAIAQEIQLNRLPSPQISISLSWMFQELLYNDPGMVEEWIDQATLEGERTTVCQVILKSMTQVSAPVFDLIVAKLAEVPAAVQAPLLRALLGMAERNQLGLEQQDVLRPVLHQLAQGGTENLMLRALAVLGWFTGASDIDWLVSFAADCDRPASVRGAALAAAGHQLAHTFRASFKETKVDGKTVRVPPPAAELVQQGERLNEFLESVALPIILSQMPAADPSLSAGAAQAVAQIFLECSVADLPAEFEGYFPVTPTQLARVLGGPLTAFWGLLDTERGATTWGPRSIGMVRQATSLLVNSNIDLLPKIVHVLATELHGPTDRGEDYRLMCLLAVMEAVAMRKPGPFADAASGHRFLVDRLAAVAVRHDAFPGRAAAMRLLGYLRKPLQESVAEAIEAALRDTWSVQCATLAIAGERITLSDELRRALVRQLSGESALTACVAARILVRDATSESATTELRREILGQLSAAASEPGAEREVFRLDEDWSTERWCVHHLGRLRDLLYHGILTVAGMI
jgi:hypothetical protein